MRKNELNARCYRREEKYLILLWNKKQISASAEVCKIDSTKELVVVEYLTDFPKELESLKQRIDLAKTYVCIIDQEEQGIDFSEDTTFVITYGDISATINVYKQDCLPPTEKDDKLRNVHSYIWDETSRTWKKDNSSTKSCMYGFNEETKVWEKTGLQKVESLLEKMSKRIDELATHVIATKKK